MFSCFPHSLKYTWSQAVSQNLGSQSGVLNMGSASGSPTPGVTALSALSCQCPGPSISPGIPMRTLGLVSPTDKGGAEQGDGPMACEDGSTWKPVALA